MFICEKLSREHLKGAIEAHVIDVQITSTIPNKRVGENEASLPSPTFNVDNQVVFSLFLLEKRNIFQCWLGWMGDTGFCSSVPTTFGWDCRYPMTKSGSWITLNWTPTWTHIDCMFAVSFINWSFQTFWVLKGISKTLLLAIWIYLSELFQVFKVGHFSYLLQIIYKFSS